jgi:hypothetical protein
MMEWRSSSTILYLIRSSDGEISPPPPHWLDMKLSEAQFWSGRCGEEKYLGILGIEPWPSSWETVAVLTELPRRRIETGSFIEVLLIN